MVSFQVRRRVGGEQEQASADVLFGDLLLSVRCRLALVILFSGLLSGCSLLNELWGQEQVSLQTSQQPRQLWQFPDSSADDVTSLLRGKGLLTPVYQVLPNNELLPDYGRTAKLYEALRQSGLSLVPAENTLEWHYKMLAAVEHKCPKGATDPLPSCEFYHWYSWLPGFGERYDKDALHKLLKKAHVDYLIMSDSVIYSSDVIHNLRYAPSSLPLVQMNKAKRETLLAPLQKDVSLAVVRVERDEHHVESWHKVIARCSLPLGKEVLTGKQLQRERGKMQDALRSKCLRELMDR